MLTSQELVLRNDIMRFSFLWFRSDIRIELQAPVLTFTETPSIPMKKKYKLSFPKTAAVYIDCTQSSILPPTQCVISYAENS